jgi:ABC-2 type transport system permease protein
MNLRNVLAITVKELSQFRRDPMTIGLTIFLPIFAVSVVSLGFGTVRDVPMVISDQDGNGQAQQIVSALRKIDTFRVVLEGNISDSDASKLVHDGFAQVAVVIPRGAGAAIAKNQQANITLMVDAKDTVVYQNVRRGLSEALRDANIKIVKMEIQENEASAQPQPVNLITDFVYGQGVSVADSLMPAIIVLMHSYIAMSLTNMSVMKEKLGRTLERLLAAPVRGSEILLGKLLAAIAVTSIGLVLLLAIGISIFRIMLLGSVVDVFLLVLLTGVGGLGLGLAVSAIAKREAEAVMMMGVYLTVGFLLTGFVWPLEAMSPMTQTIAHLVPMTYANDAVKAVMLDGLGLSAVMTDILVLGLFALATMIVGTLMFRRELVAQV